MILLVAIDFSPVTEKILAKIKELRPKMNLKIWLIHVVQPDPDFVGYEVGPPTERDFMAKQIKEKHQQIQAIAEKLKKEGIEATPLLLQGATIETIIQEGQKMKADFIVLGSHGHGMMYNLLVGSIGHGLLKNSPIPLLIIPAKD
jgi:nucleotide-binding universal stress UspA family protein